MNPKIVSLSDLENIIPDLKRQGKKIVHCHGVFDLLHVGHIRHFEAAKKYGDVLVVTITEDKYVNKGPNRPAFTDQVRAESVAALSCVDYVAINEYQMAVETIKRLRPDVYVKGSEYNTDKDYTGGIELEKEAILSVGGKIAFTDEITFSSSNLIHKYMNVYPQETINYLIEFAKKYSYEDIIQYIENIRKLKILVIGEAIIDEYCYCSSIGKSRKEPMLALKYLKTERFAGGSLAIANHISNFCDSVTLYAMLGRENSEEEFIGTKLNSNIKKCYFYKEESPTIIKRRFVEISPLAKLFEVYIFNEYAMYSAELERILRDNLVGYDVVIVSDFGHGMINKKTPSLISSNSKFLAVNTQLNAGNTGYNTISKYPRADYICLDEEELKMECRDKETSTEELISQVSDKLGCNEIIITTGPRGCITRSYNKDDRAIPAFSNKFLDRMGAGDAFFAITSPLVATLVPMEVVGFIGNAVGAMAVATIVNRDSISKPSLYKYIKTLMSI